LKFEGKNSLFTIHNSQFTHHSHIHPPLKDYHWYKIAESEAQLDFQENHIALAEVNGKIICIGRYRDDLFAFAHKCPHAGSVLSDGRIDGMGNVICPGHQYKSA
jgi:3-phenylpropionate/trans-cinnamate dioxygenase ferredoxin subunit